MRHSGRSGIRGPGARGEIPLIDLPLMLVGAVFPGAKTLTMIAEWVKHTADSGTLFALEKTSLAG